MKIDGVFLSNLHVADDIFICTETPQELQQMLQELSDGSRRMGLKINISKTNVMVVDNTTINVNNVLIENGQGYVVRDIRDFWFKFFQKHQIWLICPLWYTVSIFAERQDERPLAGRHFEKNQDGRHFSPNMYDTTL